MKMVHYNVMAEPWRYIFDLEITADIIERLLYQV